MQDKKLQDKYIIDLLKEMPNVRDERSKQEVFAKVEAGLRKRKQKQWIMPLISMAAVASLLFLLTPPFMDQMHHNNKAEKSEFKSNENQISMKAETGKMDKAVSDVQHFDRLDPFQGNVLNEIPTGKVLITFGVPDKNAQTVIPVSVLVDESKETPVAELYEYAPQLPLEDLGLGEFNLTNYDMKMVDEIVTDDQGQKVDVGDYVTITVPEGSDLEHGTDTREIFNESVNETFRWLNFSKAEYYSGTKNGILFEQMSAPESGIQVYKHQSKAYWLYQFDEKHPVLLAPYKGDLEQYDFEIALREMQKDIPERGLKASIPADVVIEGVTETKGDPNVVVKFKPGTVLENNEVYMQMMEAIMMTAADFALGSVSFEGVDNIDQIGNVMLKEKNPVPIAPNPIILMNP
ncbi:MULTISPECIES: hypothetical protein [unclassified Bacillus (in: firmicutes)]|uniref:hypothetical protein n=1 Tax=unclassified Bacillus (in: firmicutes) TaxID=185979 RepID=UPI0008DEB32D|nr:MULTISPECIES: hypothetical protein [unclassified Bacillus (in: firmicutes)]SFB13362.1 hypothetical protein SAMN02799634_106191 [Bacillus sp. UNCCL13]SFQ90035.1 hypothetical protein SAMN04488577_3628 [Bacillus sp. cl95]